MKTEMKWTRWALLAMGTLPLALLGTACTPECVDVYDCRNERTAPAGQTYTCREERCELIPMEGETPQTPADAGTDGGTEPSPDAGTGGGSDLPTDGGTDGGTVACADLPHDAKLGTLKLSAGYEVTESAVVPEGLVAVTAMPKGNDYALYALKGGTDKSIYTLGTWPTEVALGAQPLAQVVAPEDREGNVFLNTYLANDGTRLLAGYTKLGDNAPGSVLVFDTANPDKSYYQPAPGNYSAVGIEGAFLINGLGLEASSNDSAVYALQAGVTPVKPLKLATFDPKWNPFSGPTAMTSDGIAVFGYYVAESFANHLRAVAPAKYGAVLTDGAAAVDTSNAPMVYNRSDLFDIAGFGDGVALHRGAYDSVTFNAFTKSVARVPLAVSAGDAQAVTVGTLQDVLVAEDTCTNVMYLAPLGRDLLVGITDKNGRRLVRVHKP